MNNTLDIKSGNSYPSDQLSNLAHHSFIFDGIKIAGMEGLLQSFKSPDINTQKSLCVLSGRLAWKAGQKLDWHSTQTLHWNGVSYGRHTDDYQLLLDRAYQALCSNADFVKALLASGDTTLTHDVGDTDPSRTILTAKEFCSRLTLLRQQVQYQENIEW